MIRTIIMGSLILMMNILPLHANETNSNSWGPWGSSPMEIVDMVHQEANRGSNSIQDTALDTVSYTDGQYASEYRIANTLDSIRKKISPYLDWMIYIGLSSAVILLVWQGLQMVMGKSFADVRKPITNIISGVAILMGVYVIISIVTGIIAFIFGM